MGYAHDPRQNHLLAALLDAEPDHLAPHLEQVTMSLGDVVYRPEAKLPYAYFPTTAIVSLHYVLENGDASAVANVGNEGMLGISLFMGGDITPSYAVVQTSGLGYRIKASVLMEEWSHAGAVMRLMLRHTKALIAQILQIVACKRRHTVEQCLCRCLLLMQDRAPLIASVIPQKTISGMLDVRRDRLTEAIAKLQNHGYISYRRGYITVLDKAGLESKVCPCYAAIKQESDSLLSELQH